MPLDLLCDLMAKAAGRAAYAEARWVDTDSEDLRVRNGRVDELDRTRATGLGVRVRVGGGWGFAATRDVSAAGAEAALARALALAEAQPAGAARPLAALDAPARGHWASPCERDPFAVSLEDKLALLLEADAALRADARVAVALSSLHARRVDKAFASTDGAACTQTAVQCGGGVQALAVDTATGEAQARSYPTSHGGLIAQAGWEHVLALDLVAHAARVGSEAVELLSAPPCPEVTTDLVLHPEQVALQVHESIGHALELDRILLGEASYAGESWVTEDRLGALRYGSEQLTVTADATLPGGLGSFGWDDEGVEAARTELIVAGELRGTLSNRESAAAVGLERSGGCARAEGFARQPIVRMTNVSIEPGDAGSLEDLIAATDRGLYLESNRSWSIDDRRLQFQFATEVAREIRGGELGRLYRNPVYAGVTPRFWGSLDAVGDAAAWRLWGLTNCGKGEPGQVMEVSHGAAPARFRDVQVRPAS
jgi:TldD protein